MFLDTFCSEWNYTIWKCRCSRSFRANMRANTDSRLQYSDISLCVVYLIAYVWVNDCVSDYFWPSRRFVCRPLCQCIKMLSVLFDSESKILNGKITTPNRPDEFLLKFAHVYTFLCVEHWALSVLDSIECGNGGKRKSTSISVSKEHEHETW